MDCAQLTLPDFGREADVYEARPRHIRAGHLLQATQPRCDQLGQGARVHPGFLGKHHRCVGGEIAVGGIAWRLHRHRLAVYAGRKVPFAFKAVEDRVYMRGKAGVKGRHFASIGVKAAP
jgi:hypothetical protein